MKKLDLLAVALLVVGGLNWGLVAIARFDLVATVSGLDFGETNAADPDRLRPGRPVRGVRRRAASRHRAALGDRSPAAPARDGLLSIPCRGAVRRRHHPRRKQNRHAIPPHAEPARARRRRPDRHARPGRVQQHRHASRTTHRPRHAPRIQPRSGDGRPRRSGPPAPAYRPAAREASPSSPTSRSPPPPRRTPHCPRWSPP